MQVESAPGRGSLLPALCVLALISVLSAGCAPSGAAPSGANPIERAAAEATAMIESAQATAMVLRAQGTATALVGGARAPEESPTLRPAPRQTPTPPRPAEADGAASPASSPTVESAATGTTAPAAVELLRVEVGRESGLISVQFKAPPKVAQKWWQGSVSVIDEGTGAVYNEVPVLPIVGPLIGRPVRAGQLGYVMLSNAPTPLKPGAVVTVVLGEYRFEHQTVQG
jgi:type II secretory pathway pseudopilin PulG